MTDPEKFARAIALTESNADPHAYGDNGQALTSFQCHPAWVWQWATKLSISPRVSQTWESWIGDVVIAFYQHCAGLKLTPVEAAMYYHLGHVGKDDSYGNRFLTHWNALADG